MAYNNNSYGNGGKKRQNFYWREDTRHSFVNPYNFVRLGSGVERDKKTCGGCTGKIHCKLVTATPLALPDMDMGSFIEVNVNGKIQKHSVTEFFKIDGRPVIPGSEIRGVIRSAYETLSNSCLSVNNNNILSARHPTPRKPGMLIYTEGHFELYEATKRTIKNGDYPDDVNPKNGVAIRTWPISIAAKKKYPDKKEMDFVFRVTPRKIDAENLEQAVKNYIECVKIYCENNKNIKKYVNLNLKDGNYIPVFYETVTDKENNSYVYLSPAQISRSVFNNRLSDLLGSYSKCTESSNLCEACSLFGMIGERGTGAKSSLVRFSDAHLTGSTGDIYLENQTLRELEGPKTTSVEFYTDKPAGALSWSYDYKITDYRTSKDENGRKKTEPTRLMLTGDEAVTVRGRKFYLHSKADCTTKEKTNRNMTTQLIKENNEFEFDVYFDGVERSVVDKLVWTLCIGENSRDGVQMHKIGHGKPLGLGSVKIFVEDISMREVNPADKSYKVENISVQDCLEENHFDTGSCYFKDFMRITDFSKAFRNVRYPVADDCTNSRNAKASHQWFIGNRELGDGGDGTKVSIKYTLPRISEDSLELPCLLKDSTVSTSKPMPNHSNNSHVNNSRGGFNRAGNSYRNSGYHAPANNTVDVTCCRCGASGKLARASYDMLKSRGIPWVCPACKK